MISAKKISILGCGWLGYPLAKTLINNGFKVKGSTTTVEKLNILADSGIDPFLVHFKGEDMPAVLSEFLMSDVLVIAIPPGRANVERNDNYRLMSQLVTDYVGASSIKKIIFISSTSVYSDSNQDVNEHTPTSPDTPSAKLLVEIENQFLSLSNIQVCILRFSGLIGPQRHPGRFFVGKQSIPNGLAPINLIHLDDAIALVCRLIETDNVSGIFVGCCPDHPDRQTFYTIAAKQAGLPAPSFINELAQWKRVNSTRVGSELRYTFLHPDLVSLVK